MLLNHEHYRKRGTEGLALTAVAAVFALAVVAVVGLAAVELVEGINAQLATLGDALRHPGKY